MRKKKVIKIGTDDNQELVEVYEMTPLDFADVLPIVADVLELVNEEGTNFNTEKLAKVLSKNYQTLLKLLTNCTSLKEKINDYGLSYLIPVFKAFIEVNKDFLTEIKKALQGGRKN